jgi:hypothetical protein
MTQQQLNDIERLVAYVLGNEEIDYQETVEEFGADSIHANQHIFSIAKHLSNQLYKGELT